MIKVETQNIEIKTYLISYNFDLDLDNFQKIDPCGLNSKDISSLKELRINYNKAKIYQDLKEEFMKVFY